MKPWNVGEIKKTQASTKISDNNETLYDDEVTKYANNFMLCEHMW